jgi:hypothetical protein
MQIRQHGAHSNCTVAYATMIFYFELNYLLG